MGVEISVEKGVRGVWENFRGKGVRPGVELSVSDWRRVDIEEEERETFLEVDSETMR